MKPFLKWAGGKRWLVDHPIFSSIGTYNKYFEPFLGSAAMFFHFRPIHAELSDINPELINLYCIIRDRPQEIHELMKKHHVLHSREYYYQMRDQSFACIVAQAARTLYLNRTCFNGLYRVNLKGHFNVPIGTKSTVLFDSDDFDALSVCLQGKEILISDFEARIDTAQFGDFLYLDPPYSVRHNMNGFVKYNEKIFTWDDQIRLRNAIDRAATRGARIILSNADHSSILDLYKGMGQISKIPRASVMAGRAIDRRHTTEALIVI